MRLTSRRPSNRIVKAVVVVLAMALFAAACGRPENPLEIGLQRVALDLAFSKEELREPVEPKVVVQEVLAPQEQFEAAPQRPVRRITDDEVSFENPLDCPTMPAGAPPKRQTFHLVEGRPEPGAYLYKNDGQIDIDASLFTITLPYPFLTTWEIFDVADVEGSDTLQDDDLDELPGGAQDAAKEEFVEFKIRRNITDDIYIVETLRYNDEFLYLVARETTTSSGTSVFRPTPPVQILALNVEPGEEWSHSGVDRQNGTALTIDGKIVRREIIDMCGEAVDTYRIEYTESFVDLSKTPPENSGNHDDMSNVVHIVPDQGLKIIREEKHYTQRTSTEDGVPVTIKWDYVSLLRYMEVQPPGAEVGDWL